MRLDEIEGSPLSEQDVEGLLWVFRQKGAVRLIKLERVGEAPRASQASKDFYSIDYIDDEASVRIGVYGSTVAVIVDHLRDYLRKINYETV